MGGKREGKGRYSGRKGREGKLGEGREGRGGGGGGGGAYCLRRAAEMEFLFFFLFLHLYINQPALNLFNTLCSV